MLPSGLLVAMLDEPSRGSMATWILPRPLLGSAISSEATSPTSPVARSEEAKSSLA